MGSRFSGEGQGTSNEPLHRSVNNNFKFAKGCRKMELLEIMLQIGVLRFNGVCLVFLTPTRDATHTSVAWVKHLPPIVMCRDLQATN